MISFKRLGVVLFFLCVGILFLLYVTPLLIPFIIGLAIAIVLEPFVGMLETRTGLPRWLASGFTIMIFFLLFLLTIAFFVIEATVELMQLSQVLPEHMNGLLLFVTNLLPEERIMDFFERVQNWYDGLSPGYQNQVEGNLKGWFNNAGEIALRIMQNVINFLIHIVMSLPNIITILIVSIISSFLISKDYKQLVHYVRSWIPQPVQTSIGRIYFDLRKALSGFLKAQLTLVTITSMIVILGLNLMNMDYAITIGILVGLIDLLPYLGTGIIFLPWILYLYFTKQFGLVISLSILYGVVIIVRQILEPKILSKHVGINPLAALISIFVGLKLFGFLGMFFGPLMVVLLQAMNRAGVFHDLWNYIRSTSS